MDDQKEVTHRLSEEQVNEVVRRRHDFKEGRERYATDEEMAALWKKCGL
jgi:hypothetical protein